MAYGDNRSAVASDTFDSSISASWSNGEGDWDTFTWATGGYVQPTSAGSDPAMRWNADTPNNDQYSTITVQTHSTSNLNNIGARVRCASGTNESCYLGQVASTALGGDKYQIFELNSSFGFSLLTSTGTAGGLSSGHTVTVEAEGTTIRLGTAEGGADTQRVSTTDATIAGGSWGLVGYADATASECRITAWEGGNIVPASSSLIYRSSRNLGALLQM